MDVSKLGARLPMPTLPDDKSAKMPNATAAMPAKESAGTHAGNVTKAPVDSFERAAPSASPFAGSPASTGTAKDKIDPLSEMGEMSLMRLQTVMERRSKFMEMLSNVVKKMSDAASSITQNLK